MEREHPLRCCKRLHWHAVQADPSGSEEARDGSLTGETVSTGETGQDRAHTVPVALDRVAQLHCKLSTLGNISAQRRVIVEGTNISQEPEAGG